MSDTAFLPPSEHSVITCFSCLSSRNFAQHSACILQLSVTVTSPNIARPLTLLTSPSDYTTFNHQIKSFLIFNIMMPLERENSKKVSLYAFTAEQEWILANYENVVKNFLTVISNDQGFKLFTLNQVIDKVNC